MMDRGKFLQLSGISLAGLLIDPNPFSTLPKKYLLSLPDQIYATCNNQQYKLISTDKKVWAYNDLTITLQQRDDLISIMAYSPALSLNNIQLCWRYEAASNDKFLGDHWERTYGDVSWQMIGNTKKMPWYFLQNDGRNTYCFGVKTGAKSICFWQLKNKEVRLTLNTSSGGVGVQLGKRILHAADILTTKSIADETIFETGKRFCKMMCPTPKLAAMPVYGINDWYFAYGNNSAGLILEHTSLLADLAGDTGNRPFSVVDAGWAKYSPLLPNDCCWQDDFSMSNDKFKDMAKLAADIKKLGMRPALWTRPLCAKHDTNKNLLLPSIEGRNDPKQPVLDPSIEENIQQIKSTISIYKYWGFEMVKHDFTTYDIMGKWGFQMDDALTPQGWHFNDNSKTTAEIILHLYHSIRDAADTMYLIGCDTLSHLAAGIFEVNRIGDDTSGNDWERTKKMGVNTLAFRSIQHNNFYACDADCVGLTNKVPWLKNKQWMQLLAQSGTPLFISAQPNAVGNEQKEFIKKCFAAAAIKLPVAEPLDWMDSLTPSKWKLNNKIVDFNWD